jgi:hypothetical protein
MVLRSRDLQGVPANKLPVVDLFVPVDEIG